MTENRTARRRLERPASGPGEGLEEASGDGARGHRPAGRAPKRVLTGLDAATCWRSASSWERGSSRCPDSSPAPWGPPGQSCWSGSSAASSHWPVPLTYGELASRYPRQGGSFVYVLNAFGPFAAFFKGWGSFLCGYPASSAVVATILRQLSRRGHRRGGGDWSGARRSARPRSSGCLNLRGTRAFRPHSRRSSRSRRSGRSRTLALLALLVGHGSWGRLFDRGQAAGRR